MKLEQALAIVESVLAEAPGPVSVFVADGHGELVAAATMDGAAPDTRLNAQRKAYTAARSDARLDPRARREGRHEAAAELASFDPFFTFFLGGVAAFEGDRRVGAVGVSGLPGADDDALARRALAQPGSGRIRDEARTALHREHQRRDPRGAADRASRSPRWRAATLRRRRLRAEHGLERSHGSYEALLDDDGIDAVYISLPNGMHHEWTMKAIEAGKHVLVEKPYSRSPAEVEEAWDAADAAGVVLARPSCAATTRRPRSRVSSSSGRIGRLRAIHTTFSFPLVDLSNSG